MDRPQRALPPDYRALMRTYLAPQWPLVGLLAATLLTSIGLQLFIPQVLRRFIDTAIGGGATATLTAIAALYLGATLLAQFLGVAVTYAGELVGWRATNRLRGDLVRHCLRLDLPFHHARTPGEMIERIDGDVSTLMDFFSSLVVRLLGSALLLLGVLVVVARAEWRVALPLALFVAVNLTILHRCRHLALEPNRAERVASADLYGFLEERVAGMEDLRANGAGDWVLAGFGPAIRAAFLTGRRARVMTATIATTGIGLFALGTALSLGLAAYFYRAGAITLGTVFLIFQYNQLLRRPLEQISRQLQGLQRAGAGLARVNELLHARPSLADGDEAALPSGPLSLAFRDVSFGYAGATEADRALHDICLRLPAGGTLGLLGRTGSGKTTVARLLLRLYDPDAGAIELGGIDIRRVPQADLRGRIGIVTQDVQIFGASVRDNLTLFDDAIPDALLVATLRDLGLGPWLDALPEGLDTPLAAGGGLSAGEAQLLAFARVFLRDPGLVILDEASSRLDPATERLIARAVTKLLAGRTAIIIAHRLATVERVDAIAILDGGRIAEQGARAALAADPASRFARLLRFGQEADPDGLLAAQDEEVLA